MCKSKVTFKSDKMYEIVCSFINNLLMKKCMKLKYHCKSNKSNQLNVLCQTKADPKYSMVCHIL